jgi:hypothetical protein
MGATSGIGDPGATGASPGANGGSSGASGPSGAAGGASSGGTSGATYATAHYPLVTPPVRAAAPVGFGGDSMTANGLSTQHVHLRIVGGPAGGASDAADVVGAASLDASDIRSRFFGAGPTDIYSILGAIDDRINGVNAQMQPAPSCLGQEPVAYPITPFGQAITFYAQCYQSVGSTSPGDPGFVQFGQMGGATYYYSAIGAAWTAAVLTPAGGGTALDGGADDGDVDAGADPGLDGGGDADDIDGNGGNAGGGGINANANPTHDAGPVSGTYSVRAWSGVGYLNAASCGNMNGYDDCSYGVIELRADPTAHTFEMAVAGIGFGYCGAQLKSNGNTVYGTGSPDMASVCAPTGTLCVAASDVTTPAMCDDTVTSFSLPALGRVSSIGPNAGGPGVDAGPDAAWAPSQYPGISSDSIALEGTDSDSLHFGPTAPTPGVGQF